MSKYLISLDPGLRVAGCAVFKDAKLHAVTLLKNPEKTLRGPFAWAAMAHQYSRFVAENTPGADFYTFAGEMPQYYMHSQTDPDNLMQLVGVLSLCSYLTGGDRYVYYPRQWKGNMQKEAHNQLIVKALDEEEFAVLENNTTPKNVKHNIVDAIGIGLFHLMRLVRK